MSRADDLERAQKWLDDWLGGGARGDEQIVADLIAKVRANTFRAAVLALDSRVRLLGSTEFPGRCPEYVTGRVDEAIAAANALAALGEETCGS